MNHHEFIFRESTAEYASASSFGAVGFASLRGTEVDDAIRFQEFCRWLLTHEDDPHAAQKLGSLSIPYRHCAYYCAKD